MGPEVSDTLLSLLIFAESTAHQIRSRHTQSYMKDHSLFVHDNPIASCPACPGKHESFFTRSLWSRSSVPALLLQRRIEHRYDAENISRRRRQHRKILRDRCVYSAVAGAAAHVVGRSRYFLFPCFGVQATGARGFQGPQESLRAQRGDRVKQVPPFLLAMNDLPSPLTSVEIPRQHIAAIVAELLNSYQIHWMQHRGLFRESYAQPCSRPWRT